METQNPGLISPGKHGKIFAAFSSAVYGLMGTKLGRKVEGGWENGLRPLVSMVTTLFMCKSEKLSWIAYWYHILHMWYSYLKV